jgi:hypothetical protein
MFANSGSPKLRRRDASRLHKLSELQKCRHVTHAKIIMNSLHT